MFWGTLATLNVAAGVVVSSQTHRLYDLETIMRWGRYWLVEGVNVYEPGVWGTVDYPPNAIVLLSPLGLLPLGAAYPIWMVLNIAMVIIAPYCAARFFRPHDPFRVIALPILLFLCWGGVRTLTQFTLIALTCSMVAMVVAAPTAGGRGSMARPRDDEATGCSACLPLECIHAPLVCRADIAGGDRRPVRRVLPADGRPAHRSGRHDISRLSALHHTGECTPRRSQRASAADLSAGCRRVGSGCDRRFDCTGADCRRVRRRISGGSRQDAGAVCRAAAGGVLVADDLLSPHVRVRHSASGHDVARAERREAIAAAQDAFLDCCSSE